MRIAHIIGSDEIGGLEQVVQSLSIFQTKRGHHVHIIAFLNDANTKSDYIRKLENNGLTCHVFCRRGRRYIKEYNTLIQICRVIDPDILHSHGKRSDFITALACRSLGLRSVSTIHAAIQGSLQDRIYTYVQYLALSKFDAVIPVATHIAHKLRQFGIKDDRIHIVQNAWAKLEEPLSRESARNKLLIPQGARLIGWTGRLTKEKGADLFIEALALIKDLPWIASIIGDGPESMKVQHAVKKFGLIDRIYFHGAINGAGRYFTAYDCFVLSSNTEGTPMVLFEAMDTRTPIVATSVGGVPDVLSANEASLTRPGDPADLAAAISAVLQDTVRAEQKAERAYFRLNQDFEPEKWVNKYERIYEQVMH